MSDQKSVSVINEQLLPVWTATGDPVKLSDIRHQLLNLPPHYKVEQLGGHTFTIVSLKPFKSSYERQDHAYFAVCKDDKDLIDNGVFTTVFGGQMVLEVLDAVVETAMQNPLSVTMKFVRQGQYGGYWILE